MECFTGKLCRIRIKGNPELSFMGRVSAVTPSHISFTDRYGVDFCFHRDMVLEIHEYFAPRS